MTCTACRDDQGRYTPPPMEGREWQVRAKAAGLSQRLLARIAGKAENTISRQLREEFGPVPGYLIALIIAWEGMDQARRTDWREAVERELQRRERGKE